MYTSRTGLTLGFHGTDKSIVEAVLNGKEDLKPRNNPYDWLGYGVYFWDNSYSRALSWAEELSKRPNSSIKEPAVIGAILDLGNCLDLLDYSNIDLVKLGYHTLNTTFMATGKALPINKGKTEDLLLRELDCASIESLHELIKENNKPEFDSVRGVFWEGNPIYPDAGFKEKNHIQICVRNVENCIKGYFLPLERLIK